MSNFPFPPHLPVQGTSFIGRKTELSEVEHLLETTRLLTLTGSGGCGKTRLALQVAASLGNTYPGGVWRVDLASVADPTFLVKAVATALHIGGESDEVVMQTLAFYPKDKALLILDHGEHLHTTCAAFVSELIGSSPSTTVLVCSREPLDIAEEVTYPLLSLSLPDWNEEYTPESALLYEAGQLFLERASAVSPAFSLTHATARAVVDICHRLEGIPLALEIAAGCLPLLTVEQIAARLNDLFLLLTAGTWMPLPREQTLRVLLDWRYGLLSAQEQLLLRRLSVFVDGWTLHAVETICAGSGIEAGKVSGLLTGLKNKNLVLSEEQDGRMRYRLQETLRGFTRELLNRTEERETIRTKHLKWFLLFAEDVYQDYRYEQRQGGQTPRIMEELGNIRAALEWGCFHPGFEAYRLMQVLEQYWRIMPLSEGDLALCEERAWYNRIYHKELEAISPATFLDSFFRCPECGNHLRLVLQEAYNYNHYYLCPRPETCPHTRIYRQQTYESAVFRVLDYFHKNSETLDALIQASMDAQAPQKWEQPGEHQAERDALLRPRFSSSGSIGSEIASNIGGMFVQMEMDTETRIDFRTRILDNKMRFSNVVEDISLTAHGFSVYFRYLDVPMDVIVEPSEKGIPLYFPALGGDIHTQLSLTHEEHSEGATKTLQVFGTTLTLEIPANLPYRTKMRLRDAAALPGESQPRRHVIVQL